MQFEMLTIALLTPDVGKSRAFYVDLLGFEVMFDIGWFVTLAHANAGTTVDLWRQDHESVPAVLRKAPAGFVLAFVVTNVDEEVARLRAAGVRIVQPPEDKPWGQRNAIALDPAGTMIDLVQRISPDPAWLKENGLE